MDKCVISVRMMLNSVKATRRKAVIFVIVVQGLVILGIMIGKTMRAFSKDKTGHLHAADRTVIVDNNTSRTHTVWQSVHMPGMRPDNSGTTTVVMGNSSVTIAPPVKDNARVTTVAIDNTNLTKSTLAKDRVSVTTVAIGCAITSKNIRDLYIGMTEESIIKKFMFFSALLRTFCETAEVGFEYHFYLAYDANDEFFNQPAHLTAFQTAFDREVRERCVGIAVHARIHFVRCAHSGKPAWAQNEAMMAAYVHNVDYYYRINDDTKMETGNWTSAFIAVLAGFEPPDVGVVGPNHRGGNVRILTYDFVHRSHVDIFGFYYPRVFPDWYADNWITEVYRPGRSVKLDHVRLKHTQGEGRRYKKHPRTKVFKRAEIQRDRATLLRHLALSRNRTLTSSTLSRGRHVIASSLTGDDQNHTFGAIRNAMLIKLFYPGWTYRIYTHNSNMTSRRVPARIIKKLVSLGAEVVYLKSDFTNAVPVTLWKYLVADSDVKVFLLRDVSHRLGIRDAEAVHDWLESDQSAGVYCMRDHPSHAAKPITDSLWGGFTNHIRDRLNTTMEKAILLHLSKYQQTHKILRPALEANLTSSFLDDVINTAVKDDMFCHDSVSCERWPHSEAFPRARSKYEYIGRHVDAFNTLPQSIRGTLLENSTSKHCHPEVTNQSQ